MNYRDFLDTDMAFSAESIYDLAEIKVARRLVIPDVHGCIATLDALLAQIDLQKDDALFLLGDYINRGKHSAAVLDRIIDLMIEGYRIWPLRGNHEARAVERHLKAINGKAEYYPGLFKARGVSKPSGTIENWYLGFLSNLPYAYRLEDFDLVHAGFAFNKANFLTDWHSMLWLETPGAVPERWPKRLVIGHHITPLTEIMDSIERKAPLICLDNGCVYRNKKDMGNLLCLNLNDMKLWVQANVDY